MKKIYPIVLCASMFGTSNAQQTLTQANHAPLSGEQYTMMSVSPTGINPGPSGAGVTWNFNTATVSTTANNFMVEPSMKPEYPAGALAVGYSSSNVSYVTSNSNYLLYHGGNVEVQSIQANLVYSSPALYAVY